MILWFTSRKSEKKNLGEGRKIRSHCCYIPMTPGRFYPPQGIEWDLVLSYMEHLPFLVLIPHWRKVEDRRIDSTLKPKALLLSVDNLDNEKFTTC